MSERKDLPEPNLEGADLTRRRLLLRLGLASAIAYSAPVLLQLNAAHASRGSGGRGSGGRGSGGRGSGGRGSGGRGSGGRGSGGRGSGGHLWWKWRRHS